MREHLHAHEPSATHFAAEYKTCNIVHLFNISEASPNQSDGPHHPLT